ncbi:hypothetical protein PtrSN002B_008369 [Pyrenophora tritici-repentis]|uniref:Tymo-45kd-70kd domain containing protein n=1 Tax=Pyrenophora tritici-repentis TaxID=45151 RepID=A0A2W1DB32_9PLEO|nr:hypothetical protein PtrV1_08015 [Pyrenophora tritici-repentis]KAF7449060.1 hypothetical protein A1F99_061090 [Pyrenophora tritici-repentis]KAF7570942.1 Tymo-45kd-70kd domain containing protein [Pyrenophora tritici-repentis]KAG9384000.1 hypothetical protein A1F94_005911 [Pyrenophora tritici-repentis]KAI0576816.1 hypothetical protein Alg215_07271 [Pyrenophora tritici-repentis]
MPKRVRAPNCTHVDMDRVFGHDLQCQVCGRSPSIGFLYECKQDRDFVNLVDLLSPQVDKIKPCKSSLRQELEAIGLSESIILTAEKGHYTDKQLEKLKNLKLELNEIISMTEEASQVNDFVSKLTAMVRTPYATDGTYNSVPTKKSLGCTFRACHTCRPYYRDRVYISFVGVVNAEFSPMTREDIQRLPTKSAKIMSTIGTKTYKLPSSMTLDTMPSTIPTLTSFATSADVPYPPPSTASTSSSLTFKTTQTDIEEISAQRRPRRRFYKMGRRSSADIARDLSRTTAFFTPQGLKTAVQGIFRPGRESSSEGSNITLPLARTGTVREDLGDESMGEFDLGALRRVRKQKERNELRNGTYTGGFEDVGLHTAGIVDSGSGSNSISTTDSEFSVYSFATDEGGEIKVNGVALTEEAAETHTPDIMAIDVPVPENSGAAVATAEIGGDGRDEMDVDIGLQSIMAQV